MPADEEVAVGATTATDNEQNDLVLVGGEHGRGYVSLDYFQLRHRKFNCNSKTMGKGGRQGGITWFQGCSHCLY